MMANRTMHFCDFKFLDVGAIDCSLMLTDFMKITAS